MKALRYRKAVVGECIRYAIAHSSLGWVRIAATTQGICKIDFGDSPEALRAGLKAKFPKAELQESNAAFKTVLAYLEDSQRGLEIPLAPQGTPFQKRVWAALQNIPLGSTASYTEIAGQIGKPTAARAVAQACGANPVAVVIPCHRVVRSDGSLAGYRWGVERKRALLKREANCVTRSKM
ncbi:MAG: methylated-DNA--[protein]-cysteine S-methyltransferase [Cyanobacteria bacterium J06641_5]